MKNADMVLGLLLSEGDRSPEKEKRAAALLSDGDIPYVRLMDQLVEVMHQGSPERDDSDVYVVAGAILGFPEPANLFVDYLSLQCRGGRGDLRLKHLRYICGALIGLNLIERHGLHADRSDLEASVQKMLLSLLDHQVECGLTPSSLLTGKLSDAVSEYVRLCARDQSRRKMVTGMLKTLQEHRWYDSNDIPLKILAREFMYKGFALVPTSDRLSFVHTFLAGEGALVWP
jgi:hypothetical protein